MDLLVLAKEPVPGRVKTRLCPPCTDEQAAAIAEAALADTMLAAVSCGADRVIVALDGRPGPWCPPGVQVVEQGDGNLAARLAMAWRATDGPALQIGMDTPQIGADDLREAMARLDGTVDALLGLAEDGGWWALGLSHRRDEVFDGIPTSRADTGARQAQRLRAMGLATALLPTARDVDTWDDARAVAALAPTSAFAAAVRSVVDDTRGARR